jgi:hypothetical protein
VVADGRGGATRLQGSGPWPSVHASWAGMGSGRVVVAASLLSSAMAVAGKN